MGRTYSRLHNVLLVRHPGRTLHLWGKEHFLIFPPLPPPSKPPDQRRQRPEIPPDNYSGIGMPRGAILSPNYSSVAAVSSSKLSLAQNLNFHLPCLTTQLIKAYTNIPYYCICASTNASIVITTRYLANSENLCSLYEKHA